MPPRRIFHPYTAWEEVPAGMWASIGGAEGRRLLAEAITFTGDHELYGSFMLKVLDAWPVSCEHNLSDIGQNRKAWIGHAACCLAIGCPEDITREAWGYLTEEQRVAANRKASEAILTWEGRLIGQLVIS
jgi:hypothetical protein